MTPRPATSPSERPPLTERASRILACVVRQYIDRGEPVSSLWLARHGNLGISSASVRTVMARLEDDGYIHQPHTSAGRVPTDRGYRYFVDRLLQRRRRPTPPAAVEARLRRAQTFSGVLSSVSHEAVRRLAPPCVRLHAAADIAARRRPALHRGILVSRRGSLRRSQPCPARHPANAACHDSNGRRCWSACWTSTSMSRA